MRRNAHVAVVATVLGLAAVSQSVAQPSYTCYRALGPITADGTLNETTWQHAPATANAVILGTTSPPQPAPDPMTVQMAWDDNNLYLAFTVADSDVYSTINTRDDATWHQDNVEFFAWLQDPIPGDPEHDYVEYEWTPRAYIWDGLLDGVLDPMDGYSPASQWNSTGLQVGASIDGTVNDDSDTDTGFVVEAAVPWADIYYHSPGSIPGDGTQIRLNVCRIGWDSPANPQEGSDAKGADGTDVYHTWTPLAGASFHQPESFGTAVFSTDPVPEPASAMLLYVGAAALLRRRRRT